MGCSAGIISIDLAKDLLKIHNNSYALVVSTENITLNWYKGREKSMLIANTLFRVGGAAMILTNRPSKENCLELLHTVRTHKGNDDKSFQSVMQVNDDRGLTGVRLSKEVMEIAGESLKANITHLGPLFLPITEQLKYFVNLWVRKAVKKNSPFSSPLIRLYKAYFLPGDVSEIQPYIPDFTKAFDHFCIHAGGKKVIQSIEMNLNLNKEKMQASKEVLFQFGNTSSSSIWYEMDYHFNNSNVLRKQKIWQIAFGSGFKCNSAVWRVLKDIQKPSQ